MAEKNDSENPFIHKYANSNEANENGRDNDDDDDDAEKCESGAVCQDGEGAIHSSATSESSLRREENPFSFKKFLNQDRTNHRNQNLRSHLLPGEENACVENQHFNPNLIGASKMINSGEMSSVLPDFVQDHLVVEQCYLNGSSGGINPDGLNLQNLPDLNLEHDHLGFAASNESKSLGSSLQDVASNNLPDFTFSSGQYRVENGSSKFSKGLPDFTVNTSDRVSKTLDSNDQFFSMKNADSSTRRKARQRNCGTSSENSPSSRPRVSISSSPSVPLDLPSYDGCEPVQASSDSPEQPIPFDLTVAADDQNAGSSRGMPTAETVSKSLPDFLSDGPIQNDRLKETFQLGNLVSSLHNNEEQRLSSESASSRMDQYRFQRELDMLRQELAEKNQKIHALESKIEDLQSRGRRDNMSLVNALRDMENDLKQTAKRAASAESALRKSHQENGRLKLEIASLRSENSDLQMGSTSTFDPSANRNKNKRIAKELRGAANSAESSLRSLLSGIDNLRMIASSIEGAPIHNDKTDDIDDFDYEDSASGPAL